MTIRELIIQLLNEDLDDTVEIESVGGASVGVEGIRPETGRNTGIVLIVPDARVRKCNGGNMTFNDFIERLYAEGWNSPGDAQHRHITKIWEDLDLDCKTCNCGKDAANYAKSLEQTLGRVCELAYSLMPLIHSMPDELKENYNELTDYFTQVRPRNHADMESAFHAGFEAGHHCEDCCCARSWAALGETEYTGQSIPEYIIALKRDAERYRKLKDPCSGAENVIFYRVDKEGFGNRIKSGEALDMAIDSIDGRDL